MLEERKAYRRDDEPNRDLVPFDVAAERLGFELWHDHDRDPGHNLERKTQNGTWNRSVRSCYKMRRVGKTNRRCARRVGFPSSRPFPYAKEGITVGS